MDKIGSLIENANSNSVNNTEFVSLKKPVIEQKDTLDLIGDKAKDIGTGILDFGKSMLGTGVDMIEDTAKATVNLAENIYNGNLGLDYYFNKDQKKREWSDNELKQAEKLNTLSGADMLTDMLGMGGDYLKDKVLGNEITNNLKIDKDTFDSNISYIQKGIDEINGKIGSIQTGNNFKTFNDTTYQKYLKEKGISQIQDQSDYDLYVRTELARLDGITQSKILSEQNEYIKQTAELDFQRKQKEEELKTFLNENIKTDGIKTGEDIYNDYMNKQTEDIKNRSYIEALSELGNLSKQQVEDVLEAKGLAKNSTYSGYDKLKDTLIEDVTAENQYMLSIKGMKDLPDYDKLADQARDIRDVSFKFKTDVVKKFLDIRGLDENKGLSEVEIKNKALKLSWDEMSLQDKQVYKSKESFVTSVSALKNMTQAKERASNLNPLSIIDIAGYATDKIQQVLDKAYDFNSSELPHFVKQDTRSLVYSGEGLAKNIGTALTYNPDAIIGIVGTVLLGDKGISKAGTGLKLLSKITKADKIIELPATIGYGVGGTYKFVGSTIKNLSSSQLYGTIGDTVIDNVTMTAPTKAVEEFNMISNLLFDTTPFLYKEAKSGIEYSTSANRIAYEFLHGDEKRAIKQFADTNLNGDIGKAKVILDEGVRKLYSTTYNPKKYADLLTEKGALYSFVGDQLKGLEKDKLDAVLTSKGVGVQINYPEVFGLSREKQLDINDSFEKSINKNTVEGQINRVKYNNILDITANSLKAGGDGIGFTILKSRINNNPDLYSKLTKSIKEDIKIMKDTYDKEVFIETNERLKDNMKKLQSEFSNTTLEKRITLRNSFTGDNLELNVNDLETWGEKNIYDLAKEGKVKFTKGIYKGKEYNFLSKEEFTLDNHFEKFLDGKKSLIEEKEKELGLNQGIEGYAKGNDIKGIIKKFISGTTTTLKLSWIKDEEMSKSIAKITNDILSEYLNKDNIVLKNEPIYINEKLPLNKETNMAKGEDILEYMKNDDSYINISYGNFISQTSNNKGENVYIMYFMPGKKLLDNKILGKYFNGIGTSGEVNAGVVRNQGNKIVSDILKFSLNKKGNLDIAQGINRTIAELSAGSLGFFIDGKLNKLAVQEAVHEAIKSSLQKDVDTKVISDFILGAVKDFDEGQELLIEPIIYTLTNKYLNNKSIIDDVVIKAGKKEIDNKIEKVFADILLSPQVAEAIAKNIADKGRYIPDKYKIDVEELDKKAEDKIQVYISRLELRRKKLEIDLNELKEFKINAGNSQGVENIDSEINIIESRIKAIDKDIRYKSSLESKEKQKMILNEIKEFIRGKSMDASKQILGTSLDYLNKELGTPVVQTVKENYKVAKDWIKDFKKDKTLNQDKILEVLGKLSDNAGDNETIKNIIEGIDDIGIKKAVNNFYNLTKNSNIVFNKQEINNLFYNDIIDGVSQYEFALEQNILKKALKNLISNTNTDRNEVLEEKFLSYFSDKENVTMDNIQQSEKFKEFKDSITVKQGSKDVVGDAIKAKENFDKVIEEIFKGVVVSARKDGEIVDISKELIDDIINDAKFFQNIKSISNKKLLKVGDGFTAAAVKKIGDEYQSQESLFEEVPIQFEMMKKNMGDRVQYLAGFNNEYLNNSIELEYSLNKSIKGYKVDSNIESLQKGLQISPIEKTMGFMKQFNNGESFFKNLEPYVEKGYAFVGGFGDKDSGMHLYKAPDSILDFMKDGEKNMGSEIYNIAEYAYSVGYIKLNREGFEDHDKFLKKFTSFLKDKHKEKIDRYELYEALQVFTQNKPHSISEYIDGKGYFPDGLTLSKDQIDVIKTNFKDKDKTLTVQELLGDILKSDKITDEQKEGFIKISNKGNIISLKDIRKRESFNTSVRNTFGEVKKPLDLIIIDELEIDVPTDYKKFKDLKFKDLTEKDISNLIDELNKIGKDDYGIKESIQSLRDDNDNDLQFLKEVKTLLSNGFYNDMQDGTSFVSNGLLEMRGYLNGINMKGKTKHAYKQFKDHFFGEIDGVRVGGKTLFNGSTMKDSNGELITNGVAIGKSSLKLGKDLYQRAKSKGKKVDITINGRKVSGYRIEGTDTSFFKNAGSDAFDFEPEVTFSDSIKASLSIAGQQAITKLQLGKIQDAFNKTLKGLLDTDISMSAQSNIDIAMLRYISENRLGYSSNSFIGSKIDEFMREVDSIINKYKESGQSMFIYESNAKDIKPNEVIMSADSELVHTIRQEIISKRFGEDKRYKDLTKEEQLEVDDNLFTVGYRYPVPSTYNMGTYKIVLNTDKRFGKDNFYENLGSEQVVPHPVATYMKLEGDNDGDHIFFISANSDIGKIVVEDINGVKYKGLLSYKNAFDEGRLKNKFLSLAQVDKDKAIESDGTINTLANSRLAALNAKAYISNVSATIRTIKNFAYMLSENKDGLIPISTGEFGFEYKAIKDIDDLKGLDIKTDKRSFSAFAAQLLQDTLDFGNSGKSKFDTDRYNKLLGAAGIKPELQDVVQAMYINPSAVSYKPSMERYNIPQIQKDMNEGLPLKYQENSTKFLYNISGSKRELIQGLLNISHKFSDIERGELKLPEIISALNKSHDFKFMLERFKETMNQFDKGSEQYSRLKFIYDNFFSKKLEDSDFISTAKKFIGHKKSKDGTKEYSNLYEIPTKNDLDELKTKIYDIEYVRNKDTGKGGNTLSINVEPKKYKNFSIGAYEAMYVLFKDKPLTKTIEKYLTAKNKDKELIGKSLFKEILNMENQNERNIYSMMLLAGGEKKLVNILNEEEWHRFLTESDSSFKNREVTKGILLTDLIKDIGGKLPEDEKVLEEIITEYKLNLDGINKKIEQLKASNQPEDKQLISQKEKIEDSIGILNEKLIEINALKETEGKYLEGLEKTEFKYENQKYNIPGFTESFIDIDDRGANYLIGESEGVIHRTRHNLTGKVSSWFEEYTPKFVGDYNIIRDELGLKNESMLKAYDNHHLHFNESQKNKSGIIYMLKNSGIKNYRDIQRDIQYALIDYQGGKYVKKSWDKAVKDIKSIIDYNSTTKELISDEENNFFAALKNYQEGTIGEVATILNSLEARGFKVNENYRGATAKSLIIDTLESHKSDPQLTLRINGFKDRDSFETFIMNKMIESGRSDNFISRGTMRTMADTLYGSQGEWYDKILGFLKGIHYQMNYGTMSLVTGNGIMSGIAQMLPNYVELRSYLKTNINDIRIGYDVMKRTNILNSEGVLELGTGIGKDFNGDGFLDGTLDKAFQLAKGKNIQSSKASLFIHSVLTNPLGGTDYPIEALRKMVAITNTMKKLKIKDANELERKILLGGDKFEGFFKHRVMVEFASSGGGVNSSSALYKNTVFSSLHNYADIWGVRFLTQSMGYLMGWSYHKAATLIEKEASLYYGIKDLIKGNYQGAKYYIDDFLAYNTIILKQATMALGIYMKMEKYEKDTNDDVTFEGFAKTFMNSVVSMSILLEKHLNSWESADEYGGTLSDKVGYTTVGFVRNLFRLFGQTAFISTMYKHYTYSQVEGKADLFNSLQFAMNEHYSGFIRYGLNDAVNSIYGGKGLDSKVGILGTGAKTETENMINDMINGNYFGMYKEKGFIKSMYDMFDGLLIKSLTSIPVGLQQQISKDLVELAMKDKEMSKLVNGGGFGIGSNNYNIENLFGKVGSELTAEQSEGVADIYKQFNDYNYNYLGKDGIKKDSLTQSSYDRMLQKQIDEALTKEGISMEDLIKKSVATPELLKTLVVLESKYGLKNPLVISMMIDIEYKNLVNLEKETNGRVTGEYSKYGTAYKDITEEDKMKIKRDLLVKYQDYFNLNRQIGMDIIAQDIKMNHKDKLEEIKKAVDKYGSSEKDMIDYLQKSFVIGQVAKEGDTSVSKLHSRYAVAAKGLAANETTVKIVNTFLNKLFQKEGLSHKEKLANAAGFLSGLDKATYGILSNNDEFNKLTEESRKLLMNWVYKTSSEAIDFDSETLMNKMTSNSYGSPYIRSVQPKYKSKSFEGNRPGFSKQFSPLQKYIPGREQYIDKDPNGYIRKYNKPAEGIYSNLQSPTMVAYRNLLIEQLFYGYKSKGIITQKEVSKFDKPFKKDIKIAKAKKIKDTKPFVKPKQYKSYKQNLFANGPLTTYVQ